MTTYRAIIAPHSRNPVTVDLKGYPGWEELRAIQFDTDYENPVILGDFEVRSIQTHGNETTYNLMPMP